MKRVAALLIAVLALAALPASASNRSSARAGARWLAAHVRGGSGLAADTLVAMRAAGVLSTAGARSRADDLRRGARSYVTGAGQAAKVILGLASAHAGHNHDAIERLEAGLELADVSPSVRPDVYATLGRLEQKGFVRSRPGEATPERGGRARRYFTLTAAGAEALNATRATLTGLWRGQVPARGVVKAVPA